MSYKPRKNKARLAKRKRNQKERTEYLCELSDFLENDGTPTKIHPFWRRKENV